MYNFYSSLASKAFWKELIFGQRDSFDTEDTCTSGPKSSRHQSTAVLRSLLHLPDVDVVMMQEMPVQTRILCVLVRAQVTSKPSLTTAFELNVAQQIVFEGITLATRPALQFWIVRAICTCFGQRAIGQRLTDRRGVKFDEVSWKKWMVNGLTDSWLSKNWPFDVQRSTFNGSF